jgi:high-affinity nickel permease
MNLAYDWAFVKPICDVAIFVTWIASLAIWRFGKIEQKRDARQAVPDGSAG